MRSPSEQSEQQSVGEMLSYELYVQSALRMSKPGAQSFSRFVGKALIKPLPKEQTDLWPYNDKPDKIDDEFTIGIDEEGSPVRHSCDPKILSNYLGANPGAPHYLTPVFFRREVLQKYFSNPGKFAVEDNYLRCASLWGMRLDVNHEKYVIAYLGDLGRDLPKAERAHWKAFNIAPDGTISKVTFKRDFLAQFADPEKPDLRFKYLRRSVDRAFKKKFGWNLFRPLQDDDEHVLTALHIPLTNEPAEFDQQLLSLAKVLIDSLNESDLETNIQGMPSDTKGITKLLLFMQQKGVPGCEEMIRPLRIVQDLRSAGAAHRKGSKYTKLAKSLGIGDRPYSVIFAELLDGASSLLSTLAENLLTEVEDSDDV
jgi:hypothetical protein